MNDGTSNGIAHRDLFAFLAVEMEQSPAALRAAALGEAAGLDRLGEAVDASALDDLGLVLAEPLTAPDGGAPLVAAGVRLSSRKVRALLSRQRQTPDVALGPVVLAPEDAAVAHYRSKIANRLEALGETARTAAAGNLRTVHDRIGRTPALAGLPDRYREVVYGLADAPGSLQELLPRIVDPGWIPVFGRGIHTAFVAMAVVLLARRASDRGASAPALRSVGTAALTQDLGHPVGGDGAPDADHPRQSAEIARHMGLGETVAGLVAEHHAVDGAGPPSSPLARALVVANAFVGQVTNGGSHLFETIKGLTHLAENGVLDPAAVRVLGKLFLSRLKSFVIEQAFQVGRGCRQRAGAPILWPVTGDNVPSVFLCQAPECPHRTAQVSQLAQDVPFLLDGKVVRTIHKGDYFTCPLLTGQLKHLYAVIKEQGAAEVPTPPLARTG